MELKTDSWYSELRVLTSLSWPVICTNLLAYLLQLVGQGFVGQYCSVEEFAAAALGNCFFNMVWYLVQGCSTALDTLGSQAFGGGDRRMVLIWSWRCAIVLCVVCIPCTVLMLFSEVIMRAVFGLPAHLCERAALYVQLLIPGTWFWALYLCVAKYQQTQNIMVPSVLAALLANVVNVGVTHLCMNVWGWGYAGSPIATSFSRLVMLLALVLQAVCCPTRTSCQKQQQTKPISPPATPIPQAVLAPPQATTPTSEQRLHNKNKRSGSVGSVGSVGSGGSGGGNAAFLSGEVDGLIDTGLYSPRTQQLVDQAHEVQYMQ
jgi:Na+-driven multidrug efflux pump